MKIINICEKLNSINYTQFLIEQLTGKLDKIKIDTWIKPLEIENNNGDFKVICPSAFHLDIINKRYETLIRTILESEHNAKSVAFV